MAALCSWQGSLELAHVFSSFHVILVHVFELVNMQKHAEGFRILLALGSGVQGKLGVFGFLCMGSCSPVSCFSRCTFFLNWQEAMAAVDNRFRHIYPHVIPTFDDYQGQASFLPLLLLFL